MNFWVFHVHFKTLMLVVHYEHFNFLSNITSRLFIQSMVESSLIPLLQVTVELASFFHIHTASRNSRKRGIFHIPSPAGSLILSPYTLPSVVPRWIHRIDQSSGYYFRQYAPCKVVARIIYIMFFLCTVVITLWLRFMIEKEILEVQIVHKKCTLCTVLGLVLLGIYKNL